MALKLGVMGNAFLKLGVACLFLLGIARPAPAQAPKIQVLIITGQNGHDWRATTPVLRKLLEDTKRFEVRVTEEFRGGGPETLAPYDLVVLNYYDGNKPALRWGARADNALLEFVRGGKGLVVYHFSAAAFNGWTEFEQMCAGNWRPNNGHHSARHDFPVTVTDREHPVTLGMRATAYDDHALYKPGEKQPIPGPGLNQPMLWTTKFGNGRVFTTALGHDPDAMKLPGFIATFVRGAEWAATGAVTLPPPDELK